MAAVDAEALFAEHHQTLLRYLCRAIGQADAARDLAQDVFLRISRSAIVNVDRIQEIQPWFQGDYVLILTDGTRLTSTRGYRDNMRKLLGRSA